MLFASTNQTSNKWTISLVVTDEVKNCEYLIKKIQLGKIVLLIYDVTLRNEKLATEAKTE